MSVSLLRQLLMKEAVKKSAGSSGIMTINKNIAADVEKLVQKYVNDAMQQGVDLDTLGPEQLKMIVQLNKPKTPQIFSADSPEGQDMTKKLMSFLDRQSGDNVVDLAGKKIDTSQGIMGGKSVKELMESGQVQKGTDGLKISHKDTTRECLINSSLNKVDTVTDTITYIKTLDPMDAMKEANSVIGRKGKYKNLTPEESKKILTDTEDHIFERDIPIDPDDMAKGGRAGYAVGNQVMPAIDQRMNLDYNTLVDQNTAQRGTETQSRNLNTNINALKASASVPYNFAKGILGNFSNPQDLTQVSLTDAQKTRLTEIAKAKGTATGNIDYSDYGSPTPTFSGINPKTMSPLDASLALTMGGTNFKTNPEGKIEFLGGKYNFNKGSNPVYNFIDQGGVAGLIDKGGEKLFNILNPSSAEAAEPSAMPQGSPGQLNPTPTPDAGNNYSGSYQEYLDIGGSDLTESEYNQVMGKINKPTMADVAGPAATGGGYAGDNNNVVSEDPLGLIQQINKLRNGQTSSSNYSYQPEEGGYVQWNGSSYTSVSPDQIKRDIEAIQGPSLNPELSKIMKDNNISLAEAKVLLPSFFEKPTQIEPTQLMNQGATGGLENKYMMEGFDYSQPTNWSPGQPAPPGFRVVNKFGDTYIERMYPNKDEMSRMGGPMGLMGLGMMPPFNTKSKSRRRFIWSRNCRKI